MKIRAVANGTVIDWPEEGARQLIDAGIYEPVESEEPKAKPKARKS